MIRIPYVKKVGYNSTYRGEITPVKPVHKALYRGYNSIYN